MYRSVPSYSVALSSSGNRLPTKKKEPEQIIITKTRTVPRKGGLKVIENTLKDCKRVKKDKLIPCQIIPAKNV